MPSSTSLGCCRRSLGRDRRSAYPTRLEGELRPVCIGSPTWWLKTSVPIRSFLSSDAARRRLSGRRFAACAVCRRYWSGTQEYVGSASSARAGRGRKGLASRHVQASAASGGACCGPRRRGGPARRWRPRPTGSTRRAAAWNARWFAWGDEIAPGGRAAANVWQAESRGRTCSPTAGGTPPRSAASSPRATGCCDMTSNVWKRTSDTFDVSETASHCCAHQRPAESFRARSFQGLLAPVRRIPAYASAPPPAKARPSTPRPATSAFAASSGTPDRRPPPLTPQLVTKSPASIKSCSSAAMNTRASAVIRSLSSRRARPRSRPSHAEIPVVSLRDGIADDHVAVRPALPTAQPHLPSAMSSGSAATGTTESS